MKWAIFSNTWESLRTENVLYRTLVPVLVICNVISMAGWLSKDRVTVLVPPTLNEAVSVSKRSADAGYKKAWGLYVASLLGNVSPGNADFVIESLQLLMSPRVFANLKQSVAQDVSMIKRDGVAVSFEQKQVLYERETDKVFIIGRTGISNSAGTVTRFDRVFEVRVLIENGQPQIVELDSYQGKPRTQDVIKAMPPARPED
ncbi:MAG: TraE/TraK family type IV conjugative transfer system protein [Deltaproteobacteria bacterium]